MNLTFKNQDHPSLTVSARYGSTVHNFTLLEGEIEETDSGPEPARYAYKLGSDNISEEDFGNTAVGYTGPVLFGLPPGQVIE